MSRYAPIAAVLALAAILVPVVLHNDVLSPAKAQDIIMAPEGGRLDALDSHGQIIGPCPLKGTDVDVAISGRFTRVTIRQKFHNPYDDKIEAVYTFPMSHRAAVDQMVMTVGDRVVVGEVKERQRARRIYQAARDQGHVASLLEQERPNIFTQSVANIEPGAEIDVQISYVELLESKDGTFSFDFPMVVEPRYIPGTPNTSLGNLAGTFKPRRGIVLLAPATYRIVTEGDASTPSTLRAEDLAVLMGQAQAINAPEEAVTDRKSAVRFEADYAGGEKEVGELYTDGSGHVNGRWFAAPEALLTKPGAPFAADTNQVPDASKITPMPVRPDQRAGHDISISVTIDTGGPGILDLQTPLHDTIETGKVQRNDGAPRKLTVELKREREIPNRDFVLTWRQTADTIEEATFTHTGKQGKFISLILQPPARVTDAQAVPRELVFVLDTSGSMSGFPIEKAKEVMTKAIAALRPQDAFNVITFSGDTHILWEKPQPGTAENLTAAQNFISGQRGGGGTEMMKAIAAALVQAPTQATDALTFEQLMNLPADGRKVTVRNKSAGSPAGEPLVQHAVYTDGKPAALTTLRTGLRDTGMEWSTIDTIEWGGRWVTQAGQRVLLVDDIFIGAATPAKPVRICCFMTDGQVGNDQAIIDAVKQNAATTRVFSFGIGNSVNRYLLDGMARAGRGEVEYVLLNGDAEAAVQRFAQRIQTPVLTDIELVFSKGLEVTEMVPKTIPDLFDVKPIILHAKYTSAGSGTLTVRGRTGSGAYERTIPLELPTEQPEHDVIATLWARARVEELMNENLAAAQTGQFPKELHDEVVKLGESFGIMTQYTSFVAVEKQRVTIGGQPRLVHVPIEMPQGVDFGGIFGLDAVMPRGVRLRTLSANTTWGDGREGRVKQLMDQAIQEHKDRRYFAAVGTLEGVLAIDPQNDRARLMKQVIEDGIANRMPPPGTGVGGSVEPNSVESQTLSRLGSSYAKDASSAGSMAPAAPSQHFTQLHSLSPRGAAFYAESEWRMVARRDAFGSGVSGSDEYLILNGLPADGIDANGELLRRSELSADSPSEAQMGRGGRGYYGYYDLYADNDFTTLGERRLNEGESVHAGTWYALTVDPKLNWSARVTLNGENSAGISVGGTANLVFDPSLATTRPAVIGPGATGTDELNLVGVSAADQAVHQRLASIIPQVDLPAGTTFSDAVEYVRTVARVGINVDWGALAPLNITHSLNSGELSLRDARIDTILEILLDSVSTAAGGSGRAVYGVVEGAILISTPEIVAARVQTSTTTRPATQPAGPALQRGTQLAIAWLAALRSDNKLEPARILLVPQRVVLHIAELVKAGSLDDAKALAEALAKFDGEFKLGAQMRDLLADEKLAVADRDRRIAALVEEAKRAFNPIIRDIKLRTRIDGRLYPLAAAGPAAATQPAPQGVDTKDNQLRVTVLATDTQAATLKALRKAGLAIEGTAERGRLVVGLVAREQLGDLGVLDQVKRIEPTEPFN